ncbi:hypothetical protein RRG08_025850 [Elysia crispata]|uniref:Uncharacterized protein n=1 Tax=Elysia crispata TaxID=231223 RepID=A0AAE1CRW6_9GAST|nr:hypothetical protein RRG08_025850 [Elysia crispata]
MKNPGGDLRPGSLFEASRRDNSFVAPLLVHCVRSVRGAVLAWYRGNLTISLTHSTPDKVSRDGSAHCTNHSRIFSRHLSPPICSGYFELHASSRLLTKKDL